VRKANTHLSSLSEDRQEPIPDDSATIIVGTTELIAPSAVPIANSNVYLSEGEAIQELARDVNRAWIRLRSTVLGMNVSNGGETAAHLLWEHRVLPSQVAERLTRLQIRARTV
jgi:hypothetical protein